MTIPMDRALTLRTLAFDRDSVRSIDVDGRLHVALSNISKATVNPYYGREIPDADVLGLQQDRIYYLLRDPIELAQAAPTFNNLPILSEHVPVSATDHQPDRVIGSTGTDAAFNDPYLQNSAVVWAQDYIDAIESGEQRQWSCAYRYEAVMVPGIYNGLRYDGKMVNIVGNHVALVTEGRAGPDVIVGDKKPEKPKMLKSRTALMLHGALAAFVRPKLAQDAKIDLTVPLADVTADNLTSKGAKLATDVMTIAKAHLAQDADLDEGEIKAIIEAVQSEEDDMADDADPDDDDDKKKSKDKAKDKKARDADPDEDKKAKDGEPEEPKVSKGAMDTAIKAAVKANEATVIGRMNAIKQAEKDVHPHVGEVVAMDSAEAVYKFALDAAKIDLADVPPAAYKAMVAMLAPPGSTPAPKSRVAMDAASKAKVNEMFPVIGKLSRS